MLKRGVLTRLSVGRTAVFRQDRRDSAGEGERGEERGGAGPRRGRTRLICPAQKLTLA